MSDLKKPGIYKITHKASGKFYVGSAVNLRIRWGGHRSKLKAGQHRNAKLQNAWNKYGAEAFEFAVLEYVDQPESLIEREQFWLDTTQPFGDIGYNISKTAGSLLGFRHTQEMRDKLSADRKGKPRPLEVMEALRSANVGRKLSDEHKAKISVRHLGTKRPPEVIEKVTAALRGRKFSDQARANISAARIGMKLSPEHVAKVAAANTGKTRPADAVARSAAWHTGQKRSPEARERMSIAAKKRCAEQAAKRAGGTLGVEFE